MVFDVARVRGLYVSLSDGWTYLNAQENAQVPEKVSTGVAMAFRTAAGWTAAGNFASGGGASSHCRPCWGYP